MLFRHYISLIRIFPNQLCKAKYRSQEKNPKRFYTSFPFKEDRYRGIHVELNTVNAEKFGKDLQENLQTWKAKSATCVWLKIPIELSQIIPTASDQGFRFHHAEDKYSMLYLWLNPSIEPKIPRFATHQVGVSGCTVRTDTEEVLVVRDKHRPFTFWKFPGGLSELGEDIDQTAEREVFEETGIKTVFQGVLAFRQQHNQPGAFGRSDLYFICNMKPLNYEINPCSHEIEACEWVRIKDLAESTHNSAITQQVIKLVHKGLREGFHNVHLPVGSFKSVYKGMKYKLYSRGINSNDNGKQSYACDLVDADK